MFLALTFSMWDARFAMCDGNGYRNVHFVENENLKLEHGLYIKLNHLSLGYLGEVKII